MKSLVRHILFTIISLALVSRIFPQVSFTNNSVMIITGMVLVFLTLFVKPFLKILFIPVNIITFGLFAWVINIIVIYLAMLLVPGFHINPISIPSFELGIFLFPAYELSKFWSLFFVSFLVGLGNGIFSWLI